MTDVATYRVQLRDGMDFARLETLLPQIADLGVSHLYLSPILTAAPGSTHGYDVTDPTEIDPTLGGSEGFESLARAAKDLGLKVVLDIVPNHMAFGLDTPWLLDVLKNGVDSQYARVFDIDWNAGPLALPWLTKPLPEMAEAGELAIEGDILVADALRVPLAPGTAAGADLANIDALHEQQHWRLLPWQLERDSITHRRFFSVTSLIGVRVEDPQIFDKVHAATFDLVDRGLVHGLRIDHVDGLVDPGGYLRRLADRLPDTDLWIEKILVTGESLRDWPIRGTTGYEAAAMIGRALTNEKGFEQIDALWRKESGMEGDFHPMVGDAKREVLVDELAAELRQLRMLAEAVAGEQGLPVGPEGLREAITELIVAFPRYRSYVSGQATEEDREIWSASADRAAENVRQRDMIDWLRDVMLDNDTAPARAFTTRMEQVTGALLAKAHEDTAGFRFNRYLATNEVGADPDRPLTDAAEMQAFLTDRLATWPGALTLGSSHDTKRSEDARARLIAATHAPDALSSLWSDACTLPGTEALDPNRRFYAFQIALAIHGEPEAQERAAEHMVKALREGKEISYWTAPDEEREGRMQDWVRALLTRWDDRQPEALARIASVGAHISLRETALRCLMPGMPDIYQGGEGIILHLTDPDNRRPPEWDRLARLPDGDNPSSRKAELLRLLLRLRREDPDLFATGEAIWEQSGTECRLVRRLEGREVHALLGTGEPTQDGLEWTNSNGDGNLSLSIVRRGTI